MRDTLRARSERTERRRSEETTVKSIEKMIEKRIQKTGEKTTKTTVGLTREKTSEVISEVDRPRKVCVQVSNWVKGRQEKEKDFEKMELLGGKRLMVIVKFPKMASSGRGLTVEESRDLINRLRFDNIMSPECSIQGREVC